MLFRILTDSCCPLPAGLAAEHELTLLPLYSGENVPADITESKENQGDFPSDRALSEAEGLLREGNDLLYVGGGYPAGNAERVSAALERLARRYPGRRLCPVGTGARPMGLCLLLMYASALRTEGKTLAETRDWLMLNRGRVEGAEAVPGSDAEVRLLRTDAEGRSVTCVADAGCCPTPTARENAGMGAAHGGENACTAAVGGMTSPERENAISELCDVLVRDAVLPEGQLICIAHRGCPDMAERLRALISARTGAERFLLAEDRTGASAEGTVAVFFMSRPR